MKMDKRKCKLNTEENKLLGLPIDEICNLEKLGIHCKEVTRESCRRAEYCYACKRKDCMECSLNE